MLERIRSAFEHDDPQTMLVLGLSMATVGVLTASGAADVGIGVAFGTVLSACGVLLIGGVVVQAADDRTGNH